MTTEEARMTLRKLAREANRSHRQIDRATNWMVRRLNDDRTLQAALQTDIVRQACLEAVYDARHSVRLTIKAGVCDRDLDAIAAVNGLGSGGFLGRWLTPDGRPLASILGEELDPLAETEYAQAAGHRRNGEFYRALHRLVSDGERVGKAVEDSQAAAIWRKIAGVGEPKAATVAAG